MLAGYLGVHQSVVDSAYQQVALGKALAQEGLPDQINAIAGLLDKINSIANWAKTVSVDNLIDLKAHVED